MLLTQNYNVCKVYIEVRQTKNYEYPKLQLIFYRMTITLRIPSTFVELSRLKAQFILVKFEESQHDTEKNMNLIV